MNQDIAPPSLALHPIVLSALLCIACVAWVVGSFQPAPKMENWEAAMLEAQADILGDQQARDRLQTQRRRLEKANVQVVLIGILSVYLLVSSLLLFFFRNNGIKPQDDSWRQIKAKAPDDTLRIPKTLTHEIAMRERAGAIESARERMKKARYVLLAFGSLTLFILGLFFASGAGFHLGYLVALALGIYLPWAAFWGVVAVKPRDGVFFDPEGLDPEDILRYRRSLEGRIDAQVGAFVLLASFMYGIAGGCLATFTWTRRVARLPVP